MNWVRWYSKQSCKWSKWRRLDQDWLDSDPAAALRLSHGQRVQIADTLPVGASVKGHHEIRSTVSVGVLSRWHRFVANLRAILGLGNGKLEAL